MHAEFWHTHIGSERRIVPIFYGYTVDPPVLFSQHFQCRNIRVGKLIEIYSSSLSLFCRYWYFVFHVTSKTQPGIDPTLERVIPKAQLRTEWLAWMAATQGGNTGQTVNQSLNQGAKMEMHRPVIHLKMMEHKVWMLTPRLGEFPAGM